MNEFIYTLCLAIFFISLPLLAGFKWFKKIKLPWWILIIFIASLSWLLVNAAVHYYYLHLEELIQSYSGNAPKELIDRWANDGAKKVFALFVGWLYGIIYLIPWLALFEILQIIRDRFTKSEKFVK